MWKINVNILSDAKDDQIALEQKHLIQAAPFGHLDHMLRTAVQGVFWGHSPATPTHNTETNISVGMQTAENLSVFQQKYQICEMLP